jgi:EPS-associated MarR family transcriptional regulator
MDLSTNEFMVLDALDRQVITTQRQLSEHSGISLGQVNFVIKKLVEQGLVKLGNFKKNPRKIGYAYLLTPKGIETKSILAAKFITDKLNEYHSIRHRLSEKLTEIEHKAKSRIIFVGPMMIKEFLESIIKEKQMNLTLVGWFQELNDMRDSDLKNYDIIILCDATVKDLRKIRTINGIAGNKFIPFW